MKYCVLIMDGAAGWPVAEKGGRTALEIAATPNLDDLVRSGQLGLTSTIPQGMEPSSACACMSLLGYDPKIFYRGRAAIEAVSMGVPVGPDDVVFRMNLVAVKGGQMWSYCAGHITTAEAAELVDELNRELGGDELNFFVGVGYRHLLKITREKATALALCTPPHDISGQSVTGFLPHGRGSRRLRQLMHDSETVLRDHPVNLLRIAQGKIPATQIWLFWGSGPIPSMPPFRQVFGLKSAITSGVDLLRGLGQMMGMTILDIPGVTDNMQNDFAGQARGGLKSLEDHDLVVIHVEAPDEAGHAGNIDEKVAAIEAIDREVVGRLLEYRAQPLKLLVMPDHPTPVSCRTHVNEPVPFLIAGPEGRKSPGERFTERQAARAGLQIDRGYEVMRHFIGEDSFVQS